MSLSNQLLSNSYHPFTTIPSKSLFDFCHNGLGFVCLTSFTQHVFEIHLCYCVGICFYWSVVFHWGIYHSLLMHSPIDGYLSYFPFGTVKRFLWMFLYKFFMSRMFLFLCGTYLGEESHCCRKMYIFITVFQIVL